MWVWVLRVLWVCAMPAAKRNIDAVFGEVLGTGGVSQRTLESILDRLRRTPIEGTITQSRSTDLGEQLNTQTIISTIEMCSVKSACILMVAITRLCMFNWTGYLALLRRVFSQSVVANECCCRTEIGTIGIFAIYNCRWRRRCEIVRSLPMPTARRVTAKARRQIGHGG